MDTTTDITTDPRFQTSGTGAYYRIKDLLRERLGDDAANSISARATFLCNTTPGWRPSDAIRQAAREHLAGDVYQGCHA